MGPADVAPSPVPTSQSQRPLCSHASAQPVVVVETAPAAALSLVSAVGRHLLPTPCSFPCLWPLRPAAAGPIRSSHPSSCRASLLLPLGHCFACSDTFWMLPQPASCHHLLSDNKPLGASLLTSVSTRLLNSSIPAASGIPEFTVWEEKVFIHF